MNEEIKVNDTIISISNPSPDFKDKLGEAIHNALVGEPDYIKSRVCLNIDGKDEFGQPRMLLVVGGDAKTKITVKFEIERTDSKKYTVSQDGTIQENT